jgi:hypothetical protein
MDHLDRSFGRGIAMRRIDNLKTADFDSALACDLFDLGGWADQDRCDDSEFCRLRRAAERTVIARMHNKR